MKNSYLRSSTMATVAVGFLMSVAQNSALASDATFVCESNEGTPTTIIKSNAGATQPIFHWKLDAASVSNTPEELCDSVTQKLNQYATAGNDLSSLAFIPTTISVNDGEMTGLPAVCVAGESEPCQLTLFTLNTAGADNSQTPKTIAGKALDTILDPALKSNVVPSRDRGVQSTSYRVNFWDLLGF